MCAKLVGPLLSLTASGSLGNTLTFQTSKGRNTVGVKFPRKKTRTPKQMKVRAVYGEAISFWRGFTDELKAPYNLLGQRQGISGLNYFLKVVSKARYPVRYGRVQYGAVVYQA